MSNESSSRPLGGVSGVCTPQGCLYEHSPVGCKSPSEVVSTPETKASHHQLLGCPWLQSQLAVGKGKKKGASAPPLSPHPHTFQPSLIATLQNCRTNKYFLQELKRVSKKKNGLKAYSAYLVGRSNSPIVLHSDIKTDLSRRQFMAYSLCFLTVRVFFKAQLAACLQRIFLCIFCIVYYHHFAKFVLHFG